MINMATAEPSRLKRIYHVQEAGSQRSTSSSRHRKRQLCDVMRIPLWTSPRRKCNIYHQPVYRPVKWKSLEVLARTPDGSVRRLLGESHMDVWELVSPLVEEFDIQELKVNMADTGVPVDLTASAALLENDAITVEDAEFKRDSRSATDARLALVEDILYSEKEYCHTLKSVCDLYEKPLRKFLSLDNKDYRAFFDWVEPLCSLSKLVINKLENALEFWDPDHTKIGSIFSKQLWNKYEEYQCIFRNTTLPLLREKEEIDEDFVALCQLRQGAAKCSLDDLLRLPLDRLAQYEQYLSQLAEQTSEDHPDITDTYRAASKAKKMVKRTEAAKEETDLDRIQDLFPNDNLRLHDRDPLSPKKNLLRTKSAAAYKLQKALPGKSKMFPNDPYRSPQKNDNNTPQRRPSRSECVRNFIMEGAVQFTMGVQSQDRHLFLFNDLLIVAKPRSGGTYRLKEKVLVCEMWSSTCVEDVSEISLKRETSFVLGWPTVNVAVTFSSPHTKQLWEERLKQLISESKDKEGRTVTSIQFSLCNQSTRENTSSHYITLKTNNRQTAKDCIKLLLEQLGQSGTGDFQLWIKSNKDDAPYPLIGHEYPFCIKMSFIRGLLQRSDLDLRNFNNISTDTKCTFILRRKSQKATAYTSSQFSKKQKKQRRTTLISWPFKRNNNIKQDSLDSGHSSPPPGNLFGQDLGKLCTNKSIPSPIMAILTQLFQKGPFTVGIFRKSANARSCRELKEKLEANPDCDLRDVSVLVLASVLKEFLRSLPDCLLLSSLYHQWLDVVESQWAFREKVLRLINQLPSANFNVLQHLLCVLWHISQRASENKMSATNLAVCIGPSLLTSPFEPTPQSSNSQQQEVTKKVPKLVAYLIENCRDIFGEHCIHLFGEVPERDQSRQDSGAEESDSFHSLQDIGGNYRRDDSSIDSLERDYLDDGEHSPKLPSEAKMSLTNLSRDSGLTLSDTQLYTPEDEMENELTQDGEALRNKTAMLPFTKSTPHLEMTGIENNHQSCGIHGRTSGVSIDGSCNDVVKKRRHGMDCRQKPCAGNLFISSKGKNQYNDGNTHSSLLPSLSYSYGMDTGKLQCSDNEQANSSTYADIKHRKVRGRSLVRQPVISAMESREITMPIIRRSASEESLHQICIPQDSAHQHLTNKYRTPSPPYQRVTVLSSSAPDFHRDRHAIWFANQNRCVDWKRSQSTSKIDEIDYCHNNGSVSVVSSGSSTPHVSRSNSRSQDFGARSHGDIYSLYSNPKRVSSVCSSSSEASQRSHHSHISHGSNKSKRSINSQTSGGSQGSVTRIHPDSSKPCEPPSYQETINRQTLLRGIQSPSASPVDEPREEQSNLSAKARQLYENSIRMYSQKPNSTVETHHAVPVNIVNSDERISKAPPVPAKPHTPLQWTSSENASHRLRHHPPVHIKDSQISRQPNYQAKKGVSVVTYYKQRDREDLPEDWRKEINWSVAQLRSIFTSQQSSCQASNSQKSQTYHRSLANNWTANGTEKPCCQNETITSEEESLV